LDDLMSLVAAAFDCEARRGTPPERADESRRHPRVETSLRSRVWFDLPRGPKFGQAWVANLSRRGACLTRLDLGLAPDELSLLAPGTRPFRLDLAIGGARGKVSARVVRADAGRALSRLGVRFDDIEPALDRALERYIAERVADEGDRS
jgi:hypothetical protein